MGGRKLVEGPVLMTILFLFPRTKGMIYKTKPMPRRWHTSRPDQDNLEKSIKDALRGVVFKDDSQVCLLLKGKAYCAGDEAPKAVIVIESIGSAEWDHKEVRHD